MQVTESAKKCYTQRQSFEGVLKKRCSENTQGTPMVKCDFNKVAKQLYCEFGHIYWKSP